MGVSIVSASLREALAGTAKKMALGPDQTVMNQELAEEAANICVKHKRLA